MKPNLAVRDFGAVGDGVKLDTPAVTSQMPAKASRGLTRRDLIKTAALAACGVASAHPALAAADAPATPGAPPTPQTLNRFGRMVQEYFVEQLREFETANHKAKAALKTKADAEAYVRSVREKIRACFGPFPEKTPLNPRLTGVIERDAYKIEKIIFESRPGFLVTGSLYVPKGRSFPLPGVLGVCGHSNGGKAAEPYQSFSQGLARQGYVVFIIDPIGQGERLQYTKATLKAGFTGGVAEHLQAGNQQFLVGEFFGAWRAWDGIRALDYLLTRPEVDPRRVGVTGNSGGGTMTTWLCGLEPRFTMAAPSCFVTTFRHNLENELPADPEQCPPEVLALGLDQEDFIAALAPKPVILLAKEQDFFDIRGTQAAYVRLKRLYRLLGAEKNIAMFTGPTPHGYSKENREAMYRWFNGVTGISTAQTEPGLVIEEEETLWCAPKGQVAELQSRTVFAFTRERAQAMGKRRARLERAGLVRALTNTLKLPQRSTVPDYRILRPLRPRGYPSPLGKAAVYAVNTEPGIHALVYRLGEEATLYTRPPAGRSKAVLYVSHQSGDAELRDEPLIRQLLAEEPDAVFYTCDVRGIGESRPNTCGGERDFLAPYGNDYFYASHSLMLGRPYIGQKTHDALSVLDWLKSCGHTEVHLAALGWGTVPATFAALLSGGVSRVTLKHALTAYAAIAEAESYSWPLSTFLPDVLEQFDLPDCYRELQQKGLRQIEPWDASAKS